MLNKKESLLMSEIYNDAVKKNGVCVIKPIDLLTRIPYDMDFSYDELETTLEALVDDDYIEVVETEKKGEPFICITLLKRGQAFKREMVNKKRQIKQSITLKVFLSVLAGVIALVFYFLRERIF